MSGLTVGGSGLIDRVWMESEGPDGGVDMAFLFFFF